MGDRITAADVMWACVTAPCLIPPNNGGSLPDFERVPASMKAEVEELRLHVAGQFVIRLYGEDRPKKIL